MVEWWFVWYRSLSVGRSGIDLGGGIWVGCSYKVVVWWWYLSGGGTWV